MNPFANLGKAPIDPEVKQAVLTGLAQNHSDESILIPNKLPPETREIPMENLAESIDPDHQEFAKLSALVDGDFPFDDSQLAAVNGMASQKHACLTGAAGTGKTTTTKKLIDTLLAQLTTQVDMSGYFKKGIPSPEDSEDDYEAPQQWVPSVCLVGFTGRSAQMIKKNFPRDWHGNIMTIHRMLAFVPEYYDDINDNGAFVRKMRFAPTYTADCLLPWDIILIDEAGMLGLDLWHQILAATKPDTRIYMVGDINQLPPVHGRSVFGFAMAKWPAWELTHVHRQAGKNNPIVDNAWRVLNGVPPVSEGNFQMMPIKGDAQMASRIIRASAPKMRDMGIYSPNRDTIITPINGEDGSRGFALGQLALNREFALIFNPKEANVRYIIDGGRERKQFAVGDKVMATRNDHEQGITNGMTGIIQSIHRNEAYGGDVNRFGTVDEVNQYMRDDATEDDHVDISLEDLNHSLMAVEQGLKDKKEKAERGPASHIVTVRFGDDEHGFEIPFATLAEVGSLMTAYVVTCHKMQGGESPTIIIILHDAHKAMLYREWLYTAITRASQRCILMYSPDALRAALSKQSIKGKTLQEKVAAFNALQTVGIMGAAVKVKLPDAESIAGQDVDTTGAIRMTEFQRGGEAKAEPNPDTQTTTVVESKPSVINVFMNRPKIIVNQVTVVAPAPKPVESRPAPTTWTGHLAAGIGLYPPTTRSTWGAYLALRKIEDARCQKLIGFTESTPELTKPTGPINPFAFLGKK